MSKLRFHPSGLGFQEGSALIKRFLFRASYLQCNVSESNGGLVISMGDYERVKGYDTRFVWAVMIKA